MDHTTINLDGTPIDPETAPAETTADSFDVFKTASVVTTE